MGAGPRMKCTKCGDVIQSTYRHDFKWCKCGAVAIDGGDSYTKITGNPGDWKLLDDAKDMEGMRVMRAV